mmetsp:Transcript_25991/g.36434  ORF Transcript_25991/g.36434 Transcript_25991/m.36434 type:complete len:80 (+) Transcript_25991:108-347(+)
MLDELQSHNNKTLGKDNRICDTHIPYKNVISPPSSPKSSAGSLPPKSSSGSCGTVRTRSSGGSNMLRNRKSSASNFRCR